MKNHKEVSGNTMRLSKKLLKEITSKYENSENLNNLIELLESFIDPDPAELYLLESLYQLKEKIKIAESRINSIASTMVDFSRNDSLVKFVMPLCKSDHSNRFSSNR